MPSPPSNSPPTAVFSPPPPPTKPFVAASLTLILIQTASLFLRCNHTKAINTVFPTSLSPLIPATLSPPPMTKPSGYGMFRRVRLWRLFTVIRTMFSVLILILRVMLGFRMLSLGNVLRFYLRILIRWQPLILTAMGFLLFPIVMMVFARFRMLLLVTVSRLLLMMMMKKRGGRRRRKGKKIKHWWFTLRYYRLAWSNGYLFKFNERD